MTRRTRRAVLGLAGTVVAGVAGCSGFDSSSGGGTAGQPGTPAPLRLEPTEVPSSGTVVVFPSTLQDWLRDAATTGDVVRGHAQAGIYRPNPPLHRFDQVRLVDETGDLDAWFRVAGESGVRYEYSATATEATPPDDATVTPVSDLSGPRRALAEAAIEAPFSDGSRFYPETPLGEWARTDFFGGYYRHEGTVYQGMERQQTDAAFFSTSCFYIVELEPVDGASASGPTLRLGALDAQTRRAVDRARSSALSQLTPAAEPAIPSPAGADTLAESGYLLSHSAVFSVSLGEE